MRIRKAIATAGILAASLGSLTACNHDDGKTEAGTPALSKSATPSPSQSDEASASASGESTPEESSDAPLTQDQLVDAITVGQVKAGSAHVSMTMGGASAMTAEGDVSYRGASPQMKMTMSMGQMGGAPMELRYVGKVLYMTIPQLTPPGKFVKIDPRDKSNPMSKSFGSLSEQMDPLSSVRAMKAGVRSVRYVGPESVDGEDADHYVVTVDSAALMKAMDQKAVPGMPKTLTYDMWLDDQDLLRRMQFDLSGLTMDMTMSKWGEPVHVVAPPAGKVVDASSLGRAAG